MTWEPWAERSIPIPFKEARGSKAGAPPSLNSLLEHNDAPQEEGPAKDCPEGCR